MGPSRNVQKREGQDQETHQQWPSLTGKAMVIFTFFFIFTVNKFVINGLLVNKVSLQTIYNENQLTKQSLKYFLKNISHTPHYLYESNSSSLSTAPISLHLVLMSPNITWASKDRIKSLTLFLQHNCSFKLCLLQMFIPPGIWSISISTSKPVFFKKFIYSDPEIVSTTTPLSLVHRRLHKWTSLNQDSSKFSVQQPQEILTNQSVLTNNMKLICHFCSSQM